MADNPYDRPLIVTIIGILYALSAIVLLIAAVVLLVGGTAIIDEIVQENPDLDSFMSLGMATGVVFLIDALIMGAISYGFLKGWSIMWYLGLIFTIIGAVFNIFFIAMGSAPNLLSLVVQVIIILYLFKPNVKRFFLKSC